MSDRTTSAFSLLFLVLIQNLGRESGVRTGSKKLILPQVSVHLSPVVPATVSLCFERLKTPVSEA